jgi:hypothetical protein
MCVPFVMKSSFVTAPVEGSRMGKCSGTTVSSFVLRKGKELEAGREGGKEGLLSR